MSRHNYLTSRYNYLTSRHTYTCNYKSSDIRNIPPCPNVTVLVWMGESDIGKTCTCLARTWLFLMCENVLRMVWWAYRNITANCVLLGFVLYFWLWNTLAFTAKTLRLLRSSPTHPPGHCPWNRSFDEGDRGVSTFFFLTMPNIPFTYSFLRVVCYLGGGGVFFRLFIDTWN